jgi:hypothetical protein
MSNNIITNPLPFRPILKNLCNLDSTQRVEIIEHILSKMSKCLHNSITVNNPFNTDKHKIDLVKLCLGAYFSPYAKEDQNTRDALLKLIKAITIGGRFTKLHFELIYSYIALNPTDLLWSLQVIEHMIWMSNSHFNNSETVNNGIANINLPMFYFSDKDSYIEINPILATEKAFPTWFGIGIWFRTEFLNSDRSGDEYSTLFTIYSNGQGGFEAYFKDNTLYYKTLLAKKYVNGPEEHAVEVFTFETERWYTLYINHHKKYLQTSEVKILVDGQLIKEVAMDYPKMDKVGKLDIAFICKNFTGQVSSVIIFNEHIKTNNMMDILSRFPKTINAEKFLEELETDSKFKEDKIKDKLFGLFLPSRAQKFTGGDIYVEFSSSTNRAKLGPLAGVFSQDTQKNQFLFWGELKGLLPIMPLFQNIKDTELGKKTFQKFLDIIWTFTDMLTQENIKEFSLEEFFGSFFHLFYTIPIKFFSKHTIESLIEIRFKLKEDSAFFNHLIHTTDIWFNLDFEIQNFYWDYIKEIYSQGPQHYLQWVGIDKLLQIIKHLTSSKRGPCWEKHREISDKRFARKSSKYLPSTNLAQYISPILRLICNILKENAKDRWISKSVWDLASTLMYRMIPCFRIEVLKVILLLVSEEEPNNSIFKAHLKEEKHYFLILKAFNDSYFDVQTYCANIIKVLELDQAIKEKIFSFLNYVIWPPEIRDFDVSLFP